MSFIALQGMNDVKEPEIAPDGEYMLQITSAQEKTSKSGRGRIDVRLEFEDYPDYASFIHFQHLPDRVLDITNADDPQEGQRKYNIMMLNTKRFLALFGVDADEGFNVEDLVGARAMCNVTSEVDDNNITRQVLKIPRIAG